MAKVKLNPVLEQMRGPVGDLVFKHYGDGVIVGRKPDRSGVQPTDAQLQHQERFRQAVLYGQLVMADPEKKALYAEAAKASGKPLFSLTIADFFNTPAVDEVDVSAYAGEVGNPIAVRAHDDFAVVSVHVSITKFSGEAIESGKAVQTPLNSPRWTYTATATVPQGTAVRIAVTASDRPGATKPTGGGRPIP
ncbi:MAG: hypothetical protein WAN58_21595 [Anaerolineales bacterium]